MTGRSALDKFAGIAVVAMTLATTTPALAAEIVLLHAAGSLRGALTEIGKAFEVASGAAVVAKYGPSGLLKDEIAGGGGVRLRQHGASAGAGGHRQEWAGGAVRADAPRAAYRFAMFVLSAEGQRIMTRHGFGAPTLPR